jgi:hypothetical protein
VLSYVGALTMVSQALLVEPVRRTLGEPRAVCGACVLLLVSYLAQVREIHYLRHKTNVFSVTADRPARH